MHVCIAIREARGLESPVAAHFGSSPYFLLVDTATGAIEVRPNANANANAQRASGPCEPLASLEGARLDAVLVGGLGPGALAKLRAARVPVYAAPPSSALAALAALQAGRLDELHAPQACSHHASGEARAAADGSRSAAEAQAAPSPGAASDAVAPRVPPASPAQPGAHASAALAVGPVLPRDASGHLRLRSARLEGRSLAREQALERLRAAPLWVAAGQPFTVERFRPEDAPGVARLFYAVFGDGYVSDTPYVPEHLVEENRRGVTHTLVARTASGDVVGCGGLHRSSAPYPSAYEIAQPVLHPDYRTTQAAFQLQDFVAKRLIPELGIEVFFSETACHQVVNQKLMALSHVTETALELGLMPPDAYGPTEHPSERVSCLVQFGATADRRRPLYVPSAYATALEVLLPQSLFERDRHPSTASPPSGLATRASVEVFDFAQVARMHVLTLGHDFAAALDAFEAQAAGRGTRVAQVIVNLDEPWCGAGVELLRARGFFLGGALPRWFDGDGLLLQRVAELPSLESVKLHSQRAHELLALIRGDLDGNPACRGLRPSGPRRSALGEARLAVDRAEVVLDGVGLDVDGVVAAARHGRPVRLTDDRAVLARVDSSAAFIEWAVRTGEPIYGVNTGFGGMANVTIPEADLGALQHNLVRFLDAGAGPLLPDEDVRAAMLLRVNSHLRGVSGVRRALVDRVLLFLERGVTPLVRELGSIGASGDLVPLASITGAVIGADAAFRVRFEGQEMSCVEAISRLGLSPFHLGPKEGLGMVNGTSVMTGIAANVLYDARRLVALALGFHALAVQALRGSNQSFHPFIQEVKPHPGQVRAAALLRELLAGSRMCRNELDGHHESLGAQPVQDRYSLRCLPQFLGPILDGLAQAEAAVTLEMNSANDNPLVDGDRCLSFHSGNFLGQYVGVWMDHLRYYLGLLAKHVDVQVALLVAPEFSGGLPASLVGNPARRVNMGLKGLQIAANSIMPLLSFYGAPIADRFPTHAEQFNQNVNSQGFNSAVLARKALSALEAYVAMALVFGVQAVSLRAAAQGDGFDPRARLSPGTARLYEAVLGAVGATPSGERPLVWNDDEQSLSELVARLRTDIAADGATVRAVGGALEGLKLRA